MRTPVRPNEPEQTVSAFKHYQSAKPDLVLLKTKIQTIEQTPLPLLPDLALPRVRGYEIVSIIGHGGMGIVYEARHRELNRRVAIKTLRGDVLAGPEFRARFRAEAEAIARLQHPNIIQVFEVGTLELQPGEVYANPFIALEFVDGGSLTQHTRTPQPPKNAARIVETLAHAAHAAHLLGIIHRDLKPANVLLTADGVPKIADFGIAKQIESKQPAANQQLTQAGSVMGTPEYMAPEQFKEAEATPAINIYALGVILYELLTGRVPFQGATFADSMMLTMHQEPVPPRRLQPEVPRDLEVICLKCLEKSPERRYETAAALADDLSRWAEGRTIRARPIGSVGRTVRWANRNPAVAVLSFTVFLVALTGMAGIAWKWKEARENAQNAELQASNALEAAKKERWERYRVCVQAASSELRLDDSNGARRALDDAPREYQDWVWKLLYARLDKSQVVLRGRDRSVISESSSADGRWILLHGYDHSVRVWDTVKRTEFEPVRGAEANARCPAISPDGQSIAYEVSDHSIVVCESQTGQILATLRGHTKSVGELEFSQDGKRLVSTAGDGTVRIWDTKSWTLVRVFDQGSSSGGTSRLSPNQRVLASTLRKGKAVVLWEVETGRELAVLPDHAEGVRMLRFSPAGDRLATVEWFPNNIIRLWEIASGKLLATLRGHENQINHIQFSPDGTRIASSSMDRTLRIWDNSTALSGVEPQPLLTLKGHTGWVNSTTFSPDGRRLVSASQDTTLRYWDVKTGDQLAVLRGHVGVIERAAYTADGSTIISIDASEGNLRFWDTREVERDQAIKGHDSFVYGVAFHPDGERVASASWDGTARIWNATTGRQLSSFDHGKNQIVASVAFHPTGRFLATVARDDSVRLWDAESGQLVHRWSVPTREWRDTRVAFSPGGELLASGSHDGRIRLWDVKSRMEYAVLEKHTDAIRDVAFSPNGRWLASAGDIRDLTIRIWDVEKKSLVEILKGHTESVYALAWNRAGTLLASGGVDGTVRIWDTSSWREVGLLKPGTNVYGVSFTPDGKLLAAACADNMIRLWDVKTQQEIAELSGHRDYVHALAFSPDGSRLVSASGDKTLRVWDAVSPAERAKR